MVSGIRPEPRNLQTPLSSTPSRQERESTPAGFRPSPHSERDLRLDFFRGLSLLFIFIDHIPGNFLSNITLHSIAFSDAAEVFVFISGYAAALAYGRLFSSKGFRIATVHIYHRIWQLYIAHIFIFAVFAAELSYSIYGLHNWSFIDTFRIAAFLNKPHVAIVQTLLLRFQPAFLDILPLYITLLAVFPIILLAIARHPLLALVPSAILYVLAQFFGWHLTAYPAGQVWFFNPLAWQFLFTIGAVFGYSKVSGVNWVPRQAWLTRSAITTAGLTAAINISWVVHSNNIGLPAYFSETLGSFAEDKTNLDPLRLVSFLALAAATVYFVRPQNAILRTRPAKWLIVCGQNSLHIFCLGILLSVLGYFTLATFGGGVAIQLIVNLAGILLMIGLASLISWYKAETHGYTTSALLSTQAVSAPKPTLRDN
ncbi:MAG TPA: OpgC domain-containing protein [Bradyrhizobium sp.]|nr:OpgC domain-containing protein [Bradyrhizobium sp.]